MIYKNIYITEFNLYGNHSYEPCSFFFFFRIAPNESSKDYWVHELFFMTLLVYTCSNYNIMHRINANMWLCLKLIWVARARGGVNSSMARVQTTFWLYRIYISRIPCSQTLYYRNYLGNTYNGTSDSFYHYSTWMH